MQFLLLHLVAFSLVISVPASTCEINDGGRASSFERESSDKSVMTRADEVSASYLSVPTLTHRYVLDSSQSKFTARAFSGGLLWFKGHDHLVAVREFTGEAQLTPASINPASLEIVAKAASMVETRDVFTDQQKQIINKELREIVLEPDKYPDIIFKSTNVIGKAIGANQYDLNITGNLTLHGETRHISIPTQVTVTGNELRARGEFSIDRGDFKVKATSAMHGMIRVRDKVQFEFDIVGHQR